jgi:hypothetical protein
VDLAAARQVPQPPAHFGTAAEARPRCAGKVRSVLRNELTGHGRAASPEPLCVRRENARGKVSVAGASALRYRLAEPPRTTLRVVQAIGHCRTGRVRPVRVAVARFGQQNQRMSPSSVHRSACAAPTVGAGSWAICARREAAPNWALERYLRHLRSPGLRHLPPRVGSALR